MTQDLDALPLPDIDIEGLAFNSIGRDIILEKVHAHIRAARREGYELAKSEAQEGREPVAWRVRRSDGEHELFFHEPTAKQRAECFVPHSSAEPLYTSPPPKSDEARDAERAQCHAEIARLQRIIDSRPAINAGLPETYIEWSRGIYLCDYLAARGTDDAALAAQQSNGEAV